MKKIILLCALYPVALVLIAAVLTFVIHHRIWGHWTY